MACAAGAGSKQAEGNNRTLTTYKNTTLALFSDIHGGSPVGLMRPMQWQLQTVNVSPNALQRLIHAQYEDAATKIGQARKGKRLIAAFVGDAVEGLHHKSKQVISQYVKDHENIAEDAISHGLELMQFGKSDDRFYMIAGTESHVDESEERIAENLQPVPFMPAPEERVTRWCWPVLPLEINGVYGLIAHYGPGPGRGANEGNSLRNMVRDVVVGRVLKGLKPPRFVVYGHRHTKQHVQFEHGSYLCDGFILPSFQGKTDYVYSINPFAINDIGMLQINISVAGEFSWDWLCMSLTEHQERVEAL